MPRLARPTPIEMQQHSRVLARSAREIQRSRILNERTREQGSLRGTAVMESGLRFHDPVEMRKVVEEKTYQRWSIDLLINQIALPTIFRVCPFLPLALTCASKRKIYHGHCDSPLSTGCYELRTSLPWLLNEMKLPSACVLLMIMTTVDLLPNPMSYEACWFVRKYICCRKYGCTRTLVRIYLTCGTHIYGRAWRLCSVM